MPKPDEIQVLILLSLIPCVIAAIHSLVQVSEDIRTRGQEKRRRAERQPNAADRTTNRRL